MSTDFDVVVIGGAYAGLAAALQLVRVRKSVLVLDSGQARNRTAHESHGLLGHDGKSPQTIIAEAKAQLEKYPTVTFRHETVTQVKRDAEHDSFEIRCGETTRIVSRRLIIATGATDTLPDIAGLQERWGVSVAACPYCHGFETVGKPQGIIASPIAAHQTGVVPEFGPTTYFTNGVAEFEPKPEQLTMFAARGVTVEREPIVGLVGTAPELEGVKLRDGRVVPIQALYVTPKTAVSPLAAQLGLDLDQGPTGAFVKVDMFKCSSVPGCYAAGDVSSMFPNLALAIASGTMAGIGCHQSMIGK